MDIDYSKWPKLDPEFKAKWIAALRSGEYQQGTGQLCKTDEGGNAYCCLGVGALVVGIDCGTMGDLGMVTKQVFNQRKAEFSAFPEQLISEDPTTTGKLPAATLARMNDGEYIGGIWVGRKSFTEIADIIEEHL